MVAHGGGGPMHSAALARDLMAHRVIVPNSAAVFSAWGMLMTDIRDDWIRTHICPLETTPAAEINAIWSELKPRLMSACTRKGWAIMKSSISRSRYAISRSGTYCTGHDRR